MIKILIVDDEEMARSVICNILGKHFHDSVVLFKASNGKEAVKIALAEKVNIVFMDIEMQVMDGIQAGRSIKEQMPECSVIFLTAYAQFSYAKQAISLGASEYLLKPVESREVIMVVNSELQRRRVVLGNVSQEVSPNSAERDLSENAIGGKGIEARGEKIAMEAKKMIDNGFMKEISMEEMAGYFQISVNYFHKIFKQYNKVPCGEYIINVRVEKAKEYLKRPQLNVRETAAMVGYADSNYFARVFKKKTGLTPLEYRNQMFFMPNE